MPRLLAVDLDGTLLDETSHVTPRVAEAVDRARRRGVIVVICSGRRYRSMRPFLQTLSLTGYAVAQNGAVIREAAGDRSVACSPMDGGLFREILAAAPVEECPAIAHVDDYAAGLDFVYEGGRRGSPGYERYVGANAATSRPVERLRAFRHPRLIQVCWWDTVERLLAVDAAVGERVG
ncbi:MAG: HAD family phosphatase, partial [Planctomycetes bacterium]|nr:HAD family phosphatase [Planctomycetota bacterium]